MARGCGAAGSAGRITIVAAVGVAGLVAACGGGSTAGRSGTPSPSSTASAPTPPVLNLKPLLSGLLDRNGVPPAAYVTSLGGFVVQAPWSDLQRSAGAPLAADNAIDGAISTVRALNATYHIDLGLKIRVLTGTSAPAWAKNLGGPPIPLLNPQNGAEGTIGRFWTDAFGTAYDQFERLLATRYDSVPEVREVTISRCTTFYDEPFILDTGYQPNDTALLSAGFTVAADENCQRQEIDANTVWQHTHSDLALNPYQVVNSAGFNRTDEPFTESMMMYCRHVLGNACVLENNSLRSPAQPGYLAMYASMHALGQPIAFQTATLSRIGSLDDTLAYAISLGANSVELPGGYEALGTPATFASTTRALAANPLG
ncbi:MAG: hypothetical protein WCB51_09120 [Candidatus Dormiibacterota bacterium]